MPHSYWAGPSVGPAHGSFIQMIHTCILLFNLSLYTELIVISTSLELEQFGLYHFRNAAIDVCLWKKTNKTIIFSFIQCLSNLMDPSLCLALN